MEGNLISGWGTLSLFLADGLQGTLFLPGCESTESSFCLLKNGFTNISCHVLICVWGLQGLFGGRAGWFCFGSRNRILLLLCMGGGGRECSGSGGMEQAAEGLARHLKLSRWRQHFKSFSQKVWSGLEAELQNPRQCRHTLQKIHARNALLLKPLGKEIHGLRSVRTRRFLYSAGLYWGPTVLQQAYKHCTLGFQSAFCFGLVIESRSFKLGYFSSPVGKNSCLFWHRVSLNH